MSIESAKAFIQKIRDEVSFRDQLVQAASAKERRAIVRAAGFSFTNAELQQVVTELTKAGIDPLIHVTRCRDFSETFCCDVCD